MKRTARRALAVLAVLAVGAPLVLLRDDRSDAARSEPASVAADLVRTDATESARESVRSALSSEPHREATSPPQDDEPIPAPPSAPTDTPVSSAADARAQSFTAPDGVVADEVDSLDDAPVEASALTPVDEPEPEPRRKLTLRRTWQHSASETVDYRYLAVDTRSGDSYVVVLDRAIYKNRILVLGPTGDRKREFATTWAPLFGLRCAATRLETSHSNPGSTPDLVAYARPARDLRAVSSTGEPLWSQSVGLGDLGCVADLDGDGLDELILLGSDAIQVRNHLGMLLWSRPLDHGLSATAGDVVGDDRLEVIACTTSAEITVFDSLGAALAPLDPELYATVVRYAGTSTNPVIVAVGAVDETLVEVVGIRNNDAWRLSVPLEVGPRFPTLFEIDHKGRWGALAETQGENRFLLAIVDLEGRECVAREMFSKAEGGPIDLAWLPGKAVGSPTLVIATPKEIIALELVEQ